MPRRASASIAPHVHCHLHPTPGFSLLISFDTPALVALPLHPPNATRRRTKPYNLVSATALRNRVFILTLSSSARQFKKHEADLRVIQESFFVPPA